MDVICINGTVLYRKVEKHTRSGRGNRKTLLWEEIVNSGSVKLYLEVTNILVHLRQNLILNQCAFSCY